VQRERGIAILGDLVSRAFAPYMDYGYSRDPVAELLAAFDRVDGLGGIRVGLPGHGRPLPDVAGVVGEHRAGIHGRVGAAREAVAEGPAGAYEVTSRMFREPVSDQVRVWQMTEVLCYLKHLREAGDVVRDEADTGAYSYRLEPAGRPRGGP
jgi:hypothetical protein